MSARIASNSPPVRELSAIAIPADFKPGPLRLRFTATVDGRSVRAELTATVVQDGKHTSLSSARATIDGKAYLFSDAALTELLGRAGRSWDAENSSQTEAFHRGLFGGVPDAITFDGTRFRELSKDDLKGSTHSYHAGSIALD
ncbi:MAG: hypothetical protein AB1938_29675 [Myxococcota bacterium]